jgi:hypothetical protein
MFNFELFEAGSLARGGISEAASLGEQSWVLNAGVVETARACGPDAGRGRDGRVRLHNLLESMGLIDDECD